MFKSNIYIGADLAKGFVKGTGFINRYYSTKRLTNKERNYFSVTLVYIKIL